MTPKKSEQLATKSANSLPVVADWMADDAGGGLEDFTDFQQDFKIPFLKIVTSMTPEGKPHDPKYIEGIETGDIFNSVTKQVYKSLNIVRVAYKKCYIEWLPNRQGFVARHDPIKGAELEATCTKDPNWNRILPSGNILQQTHEHYVFVLDEGIGYPALISMSGGRLSASKDWNTITSQLTVKNGDRYIKPAMYGTIWEMSSKIQPSKKGDYETWNPKYVGPVADKDLYMNLKAMSDQFRSTEVGTRYDEESETQQKQEEAF